MSREGPERLTFWPLAKVRSFAGGCRIAGNVVQGLVIRRGLEKCPRGLNLLLALRELIKARVVFLPLLASRADWQAHHFPIEIGLALQHAIELSLKAGKDRVSQIPLPSFEGGGA